MMWVGKNPSLHLRPIFGVLNDNDDDTFNSVARF